MELKNCRACKKLFKSYTRDNNICPNCKAVEDRQFETIRNYLERYPLSTILRVSEGTDLRPKTIIKFIRMGRLMVVEKSPIYVECLKCGEPIRNGNYCAKCARQFNENLNIKKNDKEQNVNMELSSEKAAMHYSRNRRARL